MKRYLALALILVLLAPVAVLAQDATPSVESADVDVTSGGQVFKSYLAVPGGDGPHPAIVLMHSFGGLEEGYRTMSDQLAAEGFVTLAIGWQTFEQRPSDAVVATVIEDSIAFLKARPDVDPERIGLTGFCAGGRYTMLLLPQNKSLAAGVAWYGFPDRGEPAPAALIGDLDAPMLIIHGTKDEASPIAGIYDYATALDGAGKYFELNVYQGEPHGFMLAEGQLRQDAVATGAFAEMVSFFKRML